MRIIAYMISALMFMAFRLNAQTPFAALDRESYRYYLDKDYKNLKRTAEKLLQQGYDYYYLRMRLGVLGYEKQIYSSANKNFTRAKQLNPFDTIINEYLYYSYYFAGRTADAKQFLRSLTENQKNTHLKTLSLREDPELNLGISLVGYDVMRYQTNSLSYEAIESMTAYSAGLNFNISDRSRGYLQYSNMRKVATFYSADNPTGIHGTASQNQLYLRFKTLVSRGWELAGYTHWVFFSTENNTSTFGRRSSSYLALSTESLVGLSALYNGWYLRGGMALNYSNFENSNQFAAEGYLTYLPFSNLNLYSTVSGYYQIDNVWGNTYQSNLDLGFKVFKYLWVESGFMVGNSFLYSRGTGLVINNSYIIPAAYLYGSIIVPTPRFSLRLGANSSKIYNYSWDLSNHDRTNRVVLNSFGVFVTLTIKFI